MDDLKIIQQNTLHDLDTTKNEIADNNYNAQMMYKKVSLWKHISLQQKKQTSDEQ